VRVPSPPLGAVQNLHETDSALHQPPSREALPAEISVAIERLHRVRLIADIEEFRRFHLHAKRRFKCGDPRIELWLGAVHAAMEVIQLPYKIQLLALLISAEKSRRRDVRHRWITGLDVRQSGLVDTRQETGIVKRPPAGRSAICHHHESRHVPVLRPQSVRHPRAKTGVALSGITRVYAGLAGGANGRIGVHRIDERDVVDN